MKVPGRALAGLLVAPARSLANMIYFSTIFIQHRRAATCAIEKILRLNPRLVSSAYQFAPRKKAPIKGANHRGDKFISNVGRMAVNAVKSPRQKVESQ